MSKIKQFDHLSDLHDPTTTYVDALKSKHIQLKEAVEIEERLWILCLSEYKRTHLPQFQSYRPFAIFVFILSVLICGRTVYLFRKLEPNFNQNNPGLFVIIFFSNWFSPPFLLAMLFVTALRPSETLNVSFEKFIFHK